MSTQPWHELNRLREDVRSGALTLDEFAADLNAVRTGQAPEVYREPGDFFARTYPTYNMKLLVRDVLQRLSGQGGKPVIRIQVAYGGGKTHTLITLLHLAEHGAELSQHPTVREFLGFAGLAQVPAARVALLPFDKFDVKEGLVVYDPAGTPRRVMTPWGALAYQLAGDGGLARVAEHERDFVAPAEPLLVDLLNMARGRGVAPLVLMDEAVWYYRGAVNHDPRRLGLLKDFFQVLIQAVSKVDNAALVAALIASNVEANDLTGTHCLRALEDVFARMEEVTEPVARDDVAEVLRRRLFQSVAGEAQRRLVVDSLMAQVQRLPVRDAQKDQGAYQRLLAAYPFHPEFLDVLYGKWTQLRGFHRTRGALRLLAQALREADGHDPLPVIGPSALLAHDGPISPAINELVKACEEKGVWTPILAAELDKAREIQREFPSLKSREVEQAVIATFLHSQPARQHADPSELYGLLASPDLDPSAIAEALKKWCDISWFLIEDPDVWALGTVPNLTHMHDRAMERLGEPRIDDELRARVRGARELVDAEEGVQVHRLPASPGSVGDTVELHYVVLGPECAVEPGRPLPRQVEDYFFTSSGPQDARDYPNSVVALAPDLARLAGLREQVRRYLGWAAVELGEEKKLLNDLQRKELARRKQAVEKDLPDSVRATYSVLVAVDEQGKVEARVLPAGAETPFRRVVALLKENERLVTDTLDPDLLLPGSYFELWDPGETSKRVRELVTAFAQFPRLPRLIRPRVLLDSVVRGVREGQIVLRLARPDGTSQTWWRLEPDPEMLARPELEVLPAASARLAGLSADLLAPGVLEGLWPASGDPISIAEVRAFFDGHRAPVLVSDRVLLEAVRAVVRRGLVMARTDGMTYLREDLPADVATDDLKLLKPPPAVRGTELAPGALPEAWSDGATTAALLWDRLSARRGHRVPWVLFRDALTEALASRTFELAPGSDPWPAGQDAVAPVLLRIASKPKTQQIDPAELVGDAAQTAWASGTPTLRALKEALAAYRGEIIEDGVFEQSVQSALNRGIIILADGAGTGAMTSTTRVRVPNVTLFAEAQLSPRQLQDLADIVQDLVGTAPELRFAFRVSVSAEGAKPTPEVIAALNKLLAKVSGKWRLE